MEGGEAVDFRLRTVAAPLVASICLLIAPATASATVISDWGMNEEAGATTMVDASSNGFDGQIGSAVVLHQSTDTGGFAYSFKGLGPGPAPERLVTVPDAGASLDPGTTPYAVTIGFRTTASDPNIVQKGQSGQTGGYWKLVLNKGWPRCHFRDENGRTEAIGFVDGPVSTKVDDGRWHVLRCERTTTGVRVTLEYGTPNAVSKFIKGTIGRIDSRRPFSIGGKVDCDGGTTVGCDYFSGLIDWIRVERP